MGGQTGTLTAPPGAGSSPHSRRRGAPSGQVTRQTQPRVKAPARVARQYLSPIGSWPASGWAQTSHAASGEAVSGSGRSPSTRWSASPAVLDNAGTVMPQRLTPLGGGGGRTSDPATVEGGAREGPTRQTLRADPPPRRAETSDVAGVALFVEVTRSVRYVAGRWTVSLPPPVAAPLAEHLQRSSPTRPTPSSSAPAPEPPCTRRTSGRPSAVPPGRRTCRSGRTSCGTPGRRLQPPPERAPGDRCDAWATPPQPPH